MRGPQGLLEQAICPPASADLKAGNPAAVVTEDHLFGSESQLAATILSRYPKAASFHGASVKKLARIVYDGSHKIGEELARALIEAAANSVGSHHSEPYRLRIKRELTQLR